MSRSVRFGIIRPALLVAAAAFAWMPGAQATPPSAPPLTIDTTYPNLFYGAIPSNTQPAPGGGLNGPVIVFVHGLGGSYVDWIEAKNCPGRRGRRVQGFRQCARTGLQ